jgi:hypothetical protein
MFSQKTLMIWIFNPFSPEYIHCHFYIHAILSELTEKNMNKTRTISCRLKY